MARIQLLLGLFALHAWQTTADNASTFNRMLRPRCGSLFSGFGPGNIDVSVGRDIESNTASIVQVHWLDSCSLFRELRCSNEAFSLQ